MEIYFTEAVYTITHTFASILEKNIKPSFKLKENILELPWRLLFPKTILDTLENSLQYFTRTALREEQNTYQYKSAELKTIQRLCSSKAKPSLYFQVKVSRLKA